MSGDLGADSELCNQVGSCLTDQALQVVVGLGDLPGQLSASASDPTQGSLDSLDGIGQVAGTKPGPGLDKRLRSEPGQLLPELFGRGDHYLTECVDRRRVRLDRAVPSQSQRPDGLDHPSA